MVGFPSRHGRTSPPDSFEEVQVSIARRRAAGGKLGNPRGDGPGRTGGEAASEPLATEEATCEHVAGPSPERLPTATLAVADALPRRDRLANGPGGLARDPPHSECQRDREGRVAVPCCHAPRHDGARGVAGTAEEALHADHDLRWLLERGRWPPDRALLGTVTPDPERPARRPARLAAGRAPGGSNHRRRRLRIVPGLDVQRGMNDDSVASLLQEIGSTAGGSSANRSPATLRSAGNAPVPPLRGRLYIVRRDNAPVTTRWSSSQTPSRSSARDRLLSIDQLRR